MTSYEIGDLVRCVGTFVDKDAAEQDPTAVFCKVKPPSGEIETYVYGVDSELAKDSKGVYHVDVDITASGLWYYRFYSTGTGQAAGEGQFRVKKSEFPET